MNSKNRRIVVVDRELQSALAMRIVIYLCLTWLLVFSLPICVRLAFTNLPFDQLARSIVADFWFPICISLFLIPIVIWDSLRFGNRVAGPVYRISRTIGQIVDEQDVELIELRPQDFCKELTARVNQMIKQRSVGQSVVDQQQSDEEDADLLESVS